jgi:SAM-dependent methyltransferase
VRSLQPRESPYTDPGMAAVYAHIAAPLQFDAPARDLVEILKLHRGARVLDVGTGTGLVARHATEAVGSDGLVIGVDGSIEMLRFGGEGPGCRVAAARVPGMPFRDRTFDAVMAGFVVSHLPDYQAGLADLRRVCRVGGQVAMSSWGSLPTAASRLWSDTAATFVPRDELDQAFRAHIPWDEYFSRGMNAQRAFEDAGLHSVLAETRDYEIRMATSDFLLSREASIQGMLLRERLSVDDWEAFRRHAANAFQQAFGAVVEYVRDVHFTSGTRSRS